MDLTSHLYTLYSTRFVRLQAQLNLYITFAVTIAVITDERGDIVGAATQKL
jgi:hypothetical protein